MTNPPNSSHPTSLEAQADSVQAKREAWFKTESYKEFELWCTQGVLGKYGRWSVDFAAGDAWRQRDAHYQPIVEALKAEVEVLRKELKAIKSGVSKND